MRKIFTWNLQPTGVTQLKLDPYAIIPALGGIASSPPNIL